MNELGLGLSEAEHHADALIVKEAVLSLMRRIGATEENILTVQGNIAGTYEELGRGEEALRMQRDVYFGSVKLRGAEDPETLREADNYAASLVQLKRFEEAKSLFCKAIPVARRVLGESNGITLTMKLHYAEALYKDDGATLDEALYKDDGATLEDLREAVTTLEDAERIAQRVLVGAYPTTAAIEKSLRYARAALRARETPSES